jgi:UDP-N-acetylmuramate dehydrogenase
MSLPISLKSLNSFAIDSHCQAIYYIRHENDLLPFYGWNPRDYYILGAGSNVLLMSELSRPVLKVEIKGREIIHDEGDTVIIRVGAGENWHQLVEWTMQQGFYGLENLSLIPGTVGAAPVQNIGAYGRELQEVFVRCEAVHIPDGKQISVNKEGARMSYRDSIFKHEFKGKALITYVHLKLSRKPDIRNSYGDIAKVLESKGVGTPTPVDVSEAVISIRKRKLPDPAVLGNAGSFFKNVITEESKFQMLREKYPDLPSFPADDGKVKIPSAWLIEKNGWKGFREGDAGCHKDQALVLVNYGNASGQEILDLAHRIMRSVQEHFGLALECEVNVWD